MEGLTRMSIETFSSLDSTTQISILLNNNIEIIDSSSPFQNQQIIFQEEQNWESYWEEGYYDS